MITERATYYLIYAGLVVITFVIDMLLLKKTDKTSRIIGYVLSLIVDFSIFGFGLWLLPLNFPVESRDGRFVWNPKFSFRFSNLGRLAFLLRVLSG